MHKIIIALGLILLFSMSLCSAQEEIAITTYYPSPYGVYQELRSQRMAIGENWINSGTYPWDVDGGDPEGNEIRQDADLVVEGNVGIKMKNPLATLHLYGTGAAWGEGSRIYFGDNYNLPSWENVFIEEYGGTDSDALRIHGRMGIYLSSGGTPTPRMFIDGGGSVGIGTTASTGYTLYVNGNIGMGSAGGGGKTIWDIAEDFPAAEDVEPADVVVIDSEINQRIVKSSMPYDTMVAGIISSSPGFLIDMEDSDTPLALAGRVPCKVTTENGPIKRGDLLVTSSKPGYAMKASPDKLKPGMVLGKALEPLGEGEGKIVLLVTLQ